MTTTVAPGTTLRTDAARYDVLELLGRGGMGEVYRGRQPVLDREVAIKVLRSGSDTDRFLREARIAAKISSPHVVPVFDCHVLPDGSHVIIMELAAGRTLADIIEADGALPTDTLTRYMRHAATGMAAVADAGIVHRDLKPANLLVDESDKLRIADFGIARINSSPIGDSVAAPTLTEPGTVFGTPLYMSPEQADDSHGVDVRSDVYSYGATFYHAATGVPPFEGPGALAVMIKHKLETPAAPKARRPELPPRLNDVLERCLAKSPTDRFQSFDHVRVALSDPGVSPWEESFDPIVQQFMKRYAAERDALWNPEAGAQPALYKFPNGRILRIVRGNIADATADAIVSSDDESLTMGGGVSAVLNYRSGYVLGNEAMKFGRVRHGGVVVTGAGALKAKFVLHAVTIEYSEQTVLLPSRDILLQIMAGCFYHADTLCLRSLAFPLLGTGAAGFPQSTCLDTMMAYLIKALLFGAHTVEHVDIVLYKRDNAK